MDTQVSFRTLVERILDRYHQTSFIARWEEAIVFDREPTPLAFWTRESDDLVNVIWLTQDEVWDISWFPETETSTFNVLPLRAFSGVEVREGADAASSQGLKISGSYVVIVHASFAGGGLVWVANTDKEVTELREFMLQFLKLALGR